MARFDQVEEFALSSRILRSTSALTSSGVLPDCLILSSVEFLWIWSACASAYAPSAVVLHQPLCGVEAAHVLELALADFFVVTRSVQDLPVVALDAHVRQAPR